MTDLLHNWLTLGPAPRQLISFNHKDLLTGTLFSARVAHYHGLLSASDAKRWLLASDASDSFAIGLCAALIAGKEIVLPANTQAGTLETLENQFDAVLADRALIEVQEGEPDASTKPFIRLNPELNPPAASWPLSNGFGELRLFTSGSSGEPKAVRKRLSQLDAEVSSLERTFARHLPQCSVIATVSHQHIYGLLFKILWPLAAGRPFLSEQLEYPETLTYYTSLLPNLCLISSPAQLSRLPAALGHERQAHSPALVFSSGGPLSLDAAQGIARVYGQLPIEVYGSTETGGIGYRRQQSSEQCWQAFDDIELALDEADGALQIRSPYLEDDNWHRCDDRASLYPGAGFKLLGRLDRIVKIEEKRVSLTQMEKLLQSHPLVSEAALVLLEQPKSPHRQQLGAALVLTQTGHDLLATEGKLELNQLFKTLLLSQFERVTLPRRWRYPDALPQNTQGKRQQAQLVELFSHD